MMRLRYRPMMFELGSEDFLSYYPFDEAYQEYNEYLRNINYQTSQVQEILKEPSSEPEVVQVKPIINHHNLFMVVNNKLVVTQLMDYSVMALGKIRNNKFTDLSIEDKHMASDMGFRIGKLEVAPF